MNAVVLDAPGPVTNLHIRRLPIPEPRPGWVRIKVEAFGLNRSELHTRLGLAEGVTFPRVPGIEATGTVDADPDGMFPVGQQVAALMGGMGRVFDGGYAEYTLVPRSQVIPFTSGLPWATIGAVPETLQTAYGSLTTGLDLSAGQTLLIRGGTSALGLATATLAKDMGATVLATTRKPERAQDLADHGVDHALVDDGNIAGQVRHIFPEGVDAALELVGTPTLPDTLRATRVHGTVCFTGMLSNEWTVPDFYPISYLPRGVRLSAYGGDAGDLPAAVLQRYLDRIATGEVTLGPVHAYALNDIRTAHRDLEEGNKVGKLVGVTGSSSA
ncbi:zinc-binding alcohol dehydrogenase family protein [Streptomyces sp. CBMA152]|uniref:zinc-binding alcohol dehydrogenase family protein n=1 Tax=Streptomyces sp. CBMA152 TaxID=1896312 RepID=UPI00166167D0|nr:zinc-binding alcohol dehydrogenase family protein [Streptomyces sp. CBMA152]MBD0741299.1 NADPH:quinone reductase [Streptomyces sp. CBMA152]